MQWTRILFLLPLCLIWTAGGFASSPKLLVFAAASMRDAMLEIEQHYESECRCEVVFSFAATSTLARQIESGAPADLFISASHDWMEWLKERRKIAVITEKAIASTNLVLVTRSVIANESMELLRKGQFAMADPVSVPAGIYGKQALEKLGMWEDVKSNAVFAENVRLALHLVTRGDLDAGIVYRSDLSLAPELKVLHTFDGRNHDKIVYLAAATVNANTGAGALLDFLVSAKGQQLIKSNGFVSVTGVSDD